VGVLFYLRSDEQHILVSDTNMAVFVLIIVLCDVLIDSERSCQLKVRYVLISDTIMAVLLFMFILCDVLRDSGCSFLLKIRYTTYFS
jgi:hypothetical protein